MRHLENDEKTQFSTDEKINGMTKCQCHNLILYDIQNLPAAITPGRVLSPCYYSCDRKSKEKKIRK